VPSGFVISVTPALSRIAGFATAAASAVTIVSLVAGQDATDRAVEDALARLGEVGE
jgi:hypothetical protein